MKTQIRYSNTPENRSSGAAIKRLLRLNVRHARRIWGVLPKTVLQSLKELTSDHRLSVAAGDLLLLDDRWYVSHSGLLRLARRSRCAGISVEAVPGLSDAPAGRWAFRATVYNSRNCKGFTGYGDADPSNVSPAMRGAEMRIAETRAVNRALRKAYGIGLCSVEEIGSSAGRNDRFVNTRKLPPQPVKGNGEPKLRDQLCLLIRQYRLDAERVKQYAAEFCGTKNLRDASREQIVSFVSQLADMAAKDREALVFKLNSYAGPKAQEGAA